MMTADLFQGGLLEAPLYPLKPGVSRGPPGLLGGPGPLRPPRNSTTADDIERLTLSAHIKDEIVREILMHRAQLRCVA